LSVLTIPVNAQNVEIDTLRWLAGTWQGNVGGSRCTEFWMPPAGHSMLGVSRSVAKGEMVDYEFLRIQQEGVSIQYIAFPSGQTETAFTLVKVGPEEVVFENPEHDFPQRIIYSLNVDGVLTARIEGIMEGRMRSIQFVMKREPAQ
jgi:hypothetical protein